MTIQQPTLEQAKYLALKVLKDIMEEQITRTNVELAYISMCEVRGRKAPIFQYEDEEAMSVLIEKIEKAKREQEALERGERMEEDHWIVSIPSQWVLQFKTIFIAEPHTHTFHFEF